jgi:quinolinate synthase
MAIGTACTLDNYLALPDTSLEGPLAEARRALGSRVVLLGHHYQRDEVVKFADFRGDSFKLCQLAASREQAEYIVFCGVHFMAESADVLRRDGQQVILPDLGAGCSMADMADIGQVEDCWEALEAMGLAAGLVPVTYMNSSAAVKAFCGERGGAVCTSSNAGAAFHWAFARGRRILFLPDQHLGRNSGSRMGIPLAEMLVWDPFAPLGGNTADAYRLARVILWKGHCSVHMRFLPEHVDRARELYPGVRVIVHPECRWEVVQKADAVGSTEGIIREVTRGQPGSRWAVGTEIHLVNRLAKEHPDRFVTSLDSSGCLCATMYRISPQHLLWTLENLAEGRVVNRISVDEEVRHWARVALDRMLAIG